ncbi:MAG: hypothetical protein MAG715_01333 [Methanonatronarchaeales archaeon]|nr:hypothetical protein [Methanonatronarchaeales archaeon]
MAEFEPKEAETPYIGFGPRFVAYLIDSILAFTIIYIFYWFYRTARYGDSLGKKVMGIVIVNRNGERHLGFGKMLMREIVGRFVDWIFLGIGALWILLDDEKQAIHDKVASTYVIKKDSLPSQSEEE